MNPFIVIWYALLALLAGGALGAGVSYIVLGETPSVIRSFEMLQFLGLIVFLYSIGLGLMLTEEDIEEEDDNDE